MTTMIEPLKWTRRKEQKDYVATDGDTTYCIFGGREGWSIGTEDANGRFTMQCAENGRVIPDLATLLDAKLAVEVVRAGGADVLTEHRVDGRSVHIGGGWGGHPRTFNGEAHCSCGWDFKRLDNIREARQMAGAHQHDVMVKFMAGEKVTDASS